MKKIILASLLFVGFCLNVTGQDSPIIKKSSIALKLGYYDFNKSYVPDALSKSAVHYGIQYLKGLDQNIDFVANLDYASLKYPYEQAAHIAVPTKSNNYLALEFNVNYKFLTDKHPVVPYITGGLGMGSDHFSYYSAYMPLGAGVQIKANAGSFIFVQASYRVAASYLTKIHNDYSISYSFPLRGRNKKAVMIPVAPVKVDGDNDGVVDSLDQCPNQAGTVKYNGCPVPDSDNDGVDDEHDKCPNVNGTAKYNGCPIPDTDKDGVNDEEDKCPTQSGFSRYNGCPIPDTDKDGVNDEEDKCPTEAGIDANHGCADLQPLLNEVAKGFKFASGKVILSKKVLNKLDLVVAELNKYPNVSLDIIGNTDNTGTKKINTKLSERRAAVIFNYLTKKGIDAKRLTKEGVADEKPIATNKTKIGRAQNRRTDMNARY
jgi:OOP family OmpA-OmpF porin